MSYSFNQSAAGGERFGGLAAGSGTITLANTDGGLDALIDNYSLAGRRFTVRIGRVTDAFENHLIIRRGVIDEAEADDEAVTLTVSDGKRLDVPVSSTTYDGNGDEGGGVDLVGKRRPRLFGGAQHIPSNGITPVFVDASNLIYQVNDGALIELHSVFDRGVLLSFSADYATFADLKAASIASGFYATSIATGFFRLGASPSGAMFCSSDAEPSYLIDIIRGLALDAATGLSSQDLDDGTFDATLPGIVASYFLGPDDSSTIAELIGNLISTAGGWAAFNREGKLAVGIIEAAAGDPVAYFARDEGDIINLTRERLPSGVWPPPWRWRVAYSRNWTTFTDFAASVSGTIRARYAEPYRLAEAEDTSILADYPTAIDAATVEAFYHSVTVAQTEADRLLALYDGSRRLYRITLGREALRLKIGAVIHVTWPRWGLDAGKLMTVVAIDDKIELSDAGAGIQCEVTAFG